MLGAGKLARTSAAPSRLISSNPWPGMHACGHPTLKGLAGLLLDQHSLCTRCLLFWTSHSLFLPLALTSSSSPKPSVVALSSCSEYESWCVHVPQLKTICSTSFRRWNSTQSTGDSWFPLASIQGCATLQLWLGTHLLATCAVREKCHRAQWVWFLIH